MPPRSKRRRSAQASRRGTQRQIPGWLWLFTGVVVGAFAMFIVHLSKIKTDAPATRPTLSAKKNNEPQTETNATEKQKPVVFEFYDRFKNETVEIPEFEHPKSTSAQQKHRYFLQVASFKNESDADRARAELTLLNMTPNIEKTILASGDTRYRVVVGPYQNKSKMAKARQTLVSNGFEFLTLKRAL